METPAIDNSVPPDLFSLSGDWQANEDALYEIFLDTLVKNPVQFQGLRVGTRRHVEYKGKHFAFWHLISEGENEEERTPDYRRCERLLWISWVIKNCDQHSKIVWWENERRGQRHVVIWYEPEHYAIVLGKRNGYYLLKTAFVAKERREVSFRKEIKEASVKKP